MCAWLFLIENGHNSGDCGHLTGSNNPQYRVGSGIKSLSLRRVKGE